jgi:hypothetical protein
MTKSFKNPLSKLNNIKFEEKRNRKELKIE